MPALLIDLVEEVRWEHLETAGEPDDRRKTRIPLAPLEEGDLRPVQVAGAAERLLRQAGTRPVLLQVLAEALHPAPNTTRGGAWISGVLVEVLSVAV